MMFLDWQFTAQDDEYLDPARYQYREALILIDAMYRDVPVMWCPYIFVDNDAALACGWTRGFPKKMGSVFQTRSFAASGPAAAPVAAGSRDKPAVNELAMSMTDNMTVAGAWIGKGELKFPETNGEELDALAPSRIESGFRYSLSYSVSDLK